MIRIAVLGTHASGSPVEQSQLDKPMLRIAVLGTCASGSPVEQSQLDQPMLRIAVLGTRAFGSPVEQSQLDQPMLRIAVLGTCASGSPVEQSQLDKPMIQLLKMFVCNVQIWSKKPRYRSHWQRLSENRKPSLLDGAELVCLTAHSRRVFRIKPIEERIGNRPHGTMGIECA